MVALSSPANQWPLHYACRMGDLKQVQYLVDVIKYPVNESDTHDATPLYLAALTGNDAICKFLLERGASCDENDSARIFYVALTPELRKMLRQWSLSAASRDPFLEGWRQAFEHGEELYGDCVAYLWMSSSRMDAGSGEKQKRTVHLHRSVLMHRCPWLVNRISNKHDGSNASDLLPQIHLPEQDASCNGDIALLLFEYLYTGKFDTRDRDTVLLAKEMAASWGLMSLKNQLQVSLDQGSISGKNDRRYDISDVAGLRHDMKELARVVSTPHNEFTSLSELADLVEWSDVVTVQCQNCTWSVHRFRLIRASDYFERALQGHFREAETSFLDLSHLVETPEAIQCVIQWMYADCFLDTVPLELAVEILQLSFAILCPRLSSHVVNAVLIPLVSKESVFDLFDLARAHGCFERLEERCCEVIALNLDELVGTEELNALLAEEAAGIAQGGDVRVADVPVAAEIRRAIVRLDDIDKEEQAYRLDLLQMLVQEALHP